MPLAKRTDYGDSKYAGVEIEFAADIKETLQEAMDGGFDFVLAPLVHPLRRPPPPTLNPGDPITPVLTPQNALTFPSEWQTKVVGKISEWIDPDSPDAKVREDSEKAMLQEFGWASHLSMQAILLTPKSLDSVNYARVANMAITALQNTQVWVRIPLLAPNVAAAEGTPEEEALEHATHACSGRMVNDPYVWWDQLRALCEHAACLGVCLEMGPSLPGPRALQRWLGEPLRCVVVREAAFTTNKRGYPVLPKRHQDFLADCFRHSVQIIFAGYKFKVVEPSAPLPPGPPPGPAPLPPAPQDVPNTASEEDFPSLGAAGGRGGPAAAPSPSSSAAAEGAAAIEGPPALKQYQEYLGFLLRRMDVVHDQERFESSYRDFLQMPLQPLMHNLENETYETFEKDDTKYTQYEEAVYRALMDRVPEAEAASRRTVLMVVGAGRGPLVQASIRASSRSGRMLEIFAVEKNPNAMVILQTMKQRDPAWQEMVTLVHADMRHWVAPKPCDILVSELLGSFGDNELSPECLDGAQRFLSPTGISIPCEYTSYLAPMTSSKLYNDVKGYNDLEHLETAYVVKVHNHATLAPPLPVFTFKHPNRAQPIDNTRSLKLTFEPFEGQPTATMHGFVGYFDAKLYKDVHISIYPPTHTPNMFSWFPIYFPLRHPMHVQRGMKVEASFWRCCNNYKVWYEWAVTSPSTSPIHNVGGRSYWVGL